MDRRGAHQGSLGQREPLGVEDERTGLRAAELAMEGDELLERGAFVEHRVVEAADHDVSDVAEPIGAQKVLLCGGREGSQWVLALHALLVEVAHAGRSEHHGTVVRRAYGGVLFAHGHAFGGHALYIKDGRLKYVHDYLGMAEQVVESDNGVGTGKHVLGVEFTKQSQTPQATIGSLALYIDDEQVGSLEDVKIQNGKFALAGEGVNIGRDGGSPVTWDYPGERPWPFAGGTIKRVVVDVSGRPYIDLEKEAMAVLSRE
jgi:hypothetical protein